MLLQDWDAFAIVALATETSLLKFGALADKNDLVESIP
jgi:hypothetical protein